MSRTGLLSQDRRAVVDALLRSELYSFVQAAYPIVSGGAQLLLNWHICSLSICGRPPRGRDFHRQNALKPLRCQRTIVSGLKIIMASRMPNEQSAISLG
jgi:hypothetical protein